MFNFRKKKKAIKVEFVKTVELEGNVWKTSYHTKKDGCHVYGSYSSIQNDAKVFFDEYLRLNGMTKITEVLQEGIVYE